jgi:hypothetical protein
VIRRTLATDAVIAAVMALLVVAIAPGLAVVAIIALLVLTVCASSFALAAWRGCHRSARASKRRAR